MPGPYQSVLTSIVVSALFLAGLFTYSFVLKRKVNLFVLMILISLLPLVSMLRPGTYESGDFNIHVYRTIEFYNAIQDGQLMPSWPENLNGTYGYPLFVFINSLPYYIVSLIHFLGFGYILSMKIYLALTYTGSGIAMWFFAKKLFTNKIAIFTASIFYLFAPYHFVDLHFRAALGETLSFVVLPLVFLCVFNLVKKITVYNTVLLGATFGVFIFTHHAISIFSLLILFPYFLFLIWKKSFDYKLKVFLYAFLALLIGFSLSISVWLPHIVLREYTHADKLQSTSIMFPHVQELIFSPWKYGLLFQGPQGELSFMIGYTQLIVVGILFFLFLYKKISKHFRDDIIFWLFSFAFLFILMTPLSSLFWETIPLIKSAQFSTRLLVIMSFVTSILAGYFVLQNQKRKILIYLFICITIGYTILNWGHRRVIPEINNDTLILNTWRSSAEGEGFYGLGSPIWIDFSKPWFSTRPQTHLEILNGDATIETRKRRSIHHSYTIIVESETAYLKENTLYFPNWSVLLDGKKILINYETREFPGVITFTVPEGKHTIDVVYEDLNVIRFAKALSVFTALVIITVILFNKIPILKKKS